MRGYTSLTERLGSIEATALVNRFYEVASKAFLPFEGLLGQIAGDEVMAIFVPGLAGGSYPAKAVHAGMSLLDAAGYGKSTPSWAQDVGVGIASGEEFVGNVGGGGFKDFTAIGNPTNTAARLTSVAQAGEIVLDADTHDAVADDYRAEKELLSLAKGKEVRRGSPAPAGCRLGVVVIIVLSVCMRIGELGSSPCMTTGASPAATIAPIPMTVAI